MNFPQVMYEGMVVALTTALAGIVLVIAVVALALIVVARND